MRKAILAEMIHGSEDGGMCGLGRKTYPNGCPIIEEETPPRVLTPESIQKLKEWARNRYPQAETEET